MSKKAIRIPHELAKKKITCQHDLGVKLVNSGVELINNNRNISRSDVDSYKMKYDHWHDITSEILNEVFVSSDYPYNFRKQKSSKVNYVSSSWQPDIKYYLTKEIKPKIEYLKMLADNILTFDEEKTESKPEKRNNKMPDKHMTLKQRIENNPIIWLSSMLLAGFFAGLGTYQGILEIAHLEVISEQELQNLKSDQNTPSEAQRNPGANLGPNLTKQVEILTNAHHQRLSDLQRQLLAAEKGASNNSNPDSYKQSHRESAERIEQLISNEHKSYNENLKALRML